MSEEDKLAFVNNRIDRSEKALKEVDILTEIEHYNTAVSRLYYALFYVVSGYLAQHDFFSKTHAGTIHHFNKEVIKPGIIDKKFGKTYSKLFQMRQVGDYGDLEEFTAEDLKAIKPDTEELICLLKKLLT